MRDRDKEILGNTKDYLIRHINLSDNLLQQLRCRRLINQRQQNHIQTLGGNADQVQELLNLLNQTRDHDTFDLFCDALYAAGQLHVVFVLMHPDSARSPQEETTGHISPDTNIDAENNLYIEYPEELECPEFFDIAMLHMEDDYDMAMRLKNDLIQNIKLRHGYPPHIVIQDDPDHLLTFRSIIRYAEESIKRSTFVFVFVPKTDAWSEILSEEFLMTVINGEKKKWCRIKVLRDAKELCEKDVQFGYKAGFALDITRRNADFYDRVQKLLNLKCQERLKREGKFEEKRRIWLRTQRGEMQGFSEEQRDRSTCIREEAFRFTERGEHPVYEENSRSRSETPEGSNYDTYESSSTTESSDDIRNQESTERRQRNPGLHLEMNASGQKTFSDQPTPLGEQNTSLPAQTPRNIDILRPFLQTDGDSYMPEENAVTDAGTEDRHTWGDSQEDLHVPSTLPNPTASPPVAIVRPSPVGRSPSPIGPARLPVDPSVEEQQSSQGSQFLPSQTSAPTFQNTGANNWSHFTDTTEPLSLDLRSMPPDGGDREVPTEQQNAAATMPPIFCHSDVEGHPSLFLASLGGSVNALSSHTVGTMRLVLSRTPPLRQDSKVDSVRPDDIDEVD